MNKKKILSGVVFIAIGQICALIVWLVFDYNLFLILLIASTLGFLAGYREPSNIS